MLRGIALCVLVTSCASERAPEPAAHIEALKARVAPLVQPEPRGAIVVELGESIRIARDEQPGVWLRLRVEELAGVPSRTIDAHTRLSRLPDVDVVHVVTRGRFEELRWLAKSSASIELRYSIELGPELSTLRVVDGRVEALDHQAIARLRTEPAFAVDAVGTSRALTPHVEPHEGRWRLWFTLDAHDLVAPIAIDPAWTATTALSAVRNNASTATLPGNKVLVFGGEGPGTATEIYDAATKSWTAGPAMSRARVGVRAITLSDGRSLLVGGLGATTFPGTGDLYDPVTNTFKRTSAAAFGFVSGVAVALPSGRALVAAPAGTAVYDAKTDAWTTVADPTTKRSRFHASPLPSGKALIAGGVDASGVVLSTAELFDPTTNKFTPAGAMSSPRVDNTMDVLPSGKVVVVGGFDGGAIVDSVDVYDPTSNTWSVGPKLPTVRRNHASAVLPDGRLFVAGGEKAEVLLATTAFLDPTGAKWISAGPMLEARETFPLALVAKDQSKLLAIGGYDGTWMNAVEQFEPIANGLPCAGPGECDSGACVDGYCCEKAACAAGETCGGAAAPGHCKKLDGGACTSPDECGSGHCVDGVCCDRACDGVCEACDVKPTVGSCTTLAPGDSPHGARDACPGTGPCAARCGGVDATKCTVFPGATTACGESSCKDGAESSISFCSGAGECVAAPTVKCEPFACGEVACRKACAVDGDCASGFSCDAKSGRCVFGASCDGDHTVVVPGAPSIDCTPFKCGGSSCLEKCASTDECIAGTTCDTASGKCVVASAAADSGGCATHGGSPPAGLAVVAMVLAWCASRRRGVGR